MRLNPNGTVSAGAARHEVEWRNAHEAAFKVWPVMGGEPIERVLPVTFEQWSAWQRGAYIQSALGHLSDGEREFLLSGIEEAEWDAMFKEPDE